MVNKIKVAAILTWVACTKFIIFGSLSTKINVPDIYNIDKLIHGGAYAGLAFLSFFFTNNRKYQVLFLALLIIMGGAIEIAQLYLPPRSGTIGDFAADSIGVLVGSLIAVKLRSIIFGWLEK
jgi:VanZ family protein